MRACRRECFDGQIISWSIRTHFGAELENTMLGTAIETVDSSIKRPVLGLIMASNTADPAPMAIALR